MFEHVLRRLRPVGAAYCFYLAVTTAAWGQAPGSKPPTPVAPLPAPLPAPSAPKPSAPRATGLPPLPVAVPTAAAAPVAAPASPAPAAVAPAPAAPANTMPLPPTILPATTAPLPKPTLIHKVQAATERMEITVNTSRILTIEQKVFQAQVNNPEILDLTALSPTELQISAKAQGVTQINIWDVERKIYTVDVIVFADVQALSYVLKTHFPTSSIKVVPVANGVLLTGFVDKAEHVDLIVQIAQEYSPKVINALTVAGVQQVLLHVKLMEVSRTKLRRVGFDFANFSGGNSVVSSVSGLISAASPTSVTTTGAQTLAFGIVDGASAFFGVLDALRQDDMAKVLAEPTLVARNGRPATFNSGGEFPVPVPQSLGTISIEFKKFGTQLDFVPIVLGNGNLWLEVRPRVSELDRTNSVTVAGVTVPGIRMREAETGVEMQAGQTLAIAGLVYYRDEAQNRGLPIISEVPYLGAPFRKVSHQSNEIELLIMVTPELVEPMNASQVPPCGPGMQTKAPDDCELYLKGHLEVPNCYPGGPGCSPAPNGQVVPTSAVAPAGMIGPVDEIEIRGATPVGNGQAGVRPQGGTLGATPYVASRRPAGPPAPPVPVPPSARQAPQYRQNPASPSRPAAVGAEPALIGPIGYDNVN